jgi:hypothetical protein
MSIVDLKSELANFRVEIQPTETINPAGSKARNGKNFATVLPISDKLIKYRPKVDTPRNIDLVKKLNTTKLDDIKLPKNQSLLLNRVSQFSPGSNSESALSPQSVSTATVSAALGTINQEPFVSRLDKSDVLIIRQNAGTNNTTSDVEPPAVVQSIDRKASSPDIVVNRNDASDNITNPNTVINNIPLTFNREGQSVIINKDLVSPINNVINPNVALERRPQFTDRSSESPNIITDTIQQGLVVNPNTKILRVQNGVNHLTDESNLNPDGKPIRFVATSRLANVSPSQEADVDRYDGNSVIENSNSLFNIDAVRLTNPSGRNEDPNRSNLSIIGTQQVDVFSNANATGFTTRQQIGQSKYIPNSVFSWAGNRDSAPTTNFITDTYGVGFKKFAQTGETSFTGVISNFGFNQAQPVDFFDIDKKHTTDGFRIQARPLETNYKSDASVFGWSGKKEGAPETDYFDITGQYTVSGFHKFAQKFDSKYIADSSGFGWQGSSTSAPESNYFDISGQYTTSGFTKFAQVFDSKYITDSSVFGWSGNPQSAPETNYFDVTGQHSSAGFHKFAQVFDSKYLLDSSIFGWNGKREQAPEANYFDITGQYATIGFHKFAQLYDSKYIADSSQFNWDGVPQSAPEVNYFDITGQYTTTGFHKFAQTYDTKYIPDSSVFDWDGTKEGAPVVNYFDITGQHSSVGFHSFAQTYDTKYIPDSSVFDWDGVRQAAPVVNYFDITGQHSSTGFHSFAQIYDSKYIPEASLFDWDGARDSAPVVNYFDISGQHSSTGFHSFAQLYDTKYIPEASLFDWDGTRDSAPVVNYFDITGQHSSTGFHSFAQLYDSKYIPEASVFDWDGKRADAKTVNFIDIARKYVTAGFHKFAQIYDTKYIPEASLFDWDGKRADAKTVNFIDIARKNVTAGFHSFAQLYDTKYIPESSVFDWDGKRTDAKAVNYFDISNQNSTTGFHTFAQIYDSKYIPASSIYNWDGNRDSAPVVNYFDVSNTYSSAGFRSFAQLYDSVYVPNSSLFDWDGNRADAQTINFFDVSRRNVTAGFHKFAQIYDSKYVKDSSIFDWDGRRSAAKTINYFDVSRKNVREGFHKFARIGDSKYITESSPFTFRGKLPTPVNFFVNTNASGFDNRFTTNQTRYVKDSSKFTFKGSQPTPVNYFPDTNAVGFDIKAQSLISKYVQDSSKFTFKGSQPTPVNYFVNTNAEGFTIKSNELESKYVNESSQFTFKGTIPTSPVNYFTDTNADGFTIKQSALESKFKNDTSNLTFKGTIPDSPVNYFTDTNADGFTVKQSALESKYKNETSNFDFKGPKPTPSNYIQDIFSDGFVINSQLLASNYKIREGESNISGNSLTQLADASKKMTWVGARINAPAFNSSIGPSNIGQSGDADPTSVGLVNSTAPKTSPLKQNISPGFIPFLNNKVDSAFDTTLSGLSTNSLTPAFNINKGNVYARGAQKPTDFPRTSFFGYDATSYSGFLLGMSKSTDGTLYPLITPSLSADATAESRLQVEVQRSSGGVRSSNFEKYAPLSLGKRPWVDGKLASLDNQVPDSKISAIPGSYFNKYEENMRNRTDRKGYLTTWALRQRSLSPLQQNYNKLNLLQDSYNTSPDQSAHEPFILRGIQQPFVFDNNRWGSTVSDSELRNVLSQRRLPDSYASTGIAAYIDIGKRDLERADKWLKSIRGRQWLLRQEGIQRMNPVVDFDLQSPLSFVGFEGKELPTNLFFNLDAWRKNVEQRGLPPTVAKHYARHGVGLATQQTRQSLNMYETATLGSGGSGRGTERVSFDLKYEQLETATSDRTGRGYNRLIGLMKELLPNSFYPTDTKPENGGSTIQRISSTFGGPNSFIGLGGTTINRARHPFLTFYTTSPKQDNAVSDNNKRNTFYSLLAPPPASATQTTGPSSTANPLNSMYSTNVMDLMNVSSNKLDGMLSALLYVLDGGPITETFGGYSKTAAEESLKLQQNTISRIKSYKVFTPSHPLPYERTKAYNTNMRASGSVVPLSSNNNAGQYQVQQTQASTDSTGSNAATLQFDPLKNYRTLPYSKLQKFSPNSADLNGTRRTKFNDFRDDLDLAGTEAYNTNPKVIRFGSRNLEDFFGLGSQGKPGVQRNLPFVSSVAYTKNTKAVDNPNRNFPEFSNYAIPRQKPGTDAPEFRGDRINIIDYKRANFNLSRDLIYETNGFNTSIPGAQDLIQFYFSSIVLSGHNYCPAEVIVFRAIFDNITDSHNPSWNPIKYMGRADPLYTYEGYERSVNFGFTVHIGSRDEMKASWRKLNYLASWTAPEYTKNGFIRGPLIRLNIGNLFRKMPGFINSLSYSFDNTGTTWEIAKLLEDDAMNQKTSPGVLELPKTVNVSVGFTPVGMYRPEFRGVMYSLYDDYAGGALENGLIPNHDNKVNYFKTYDDVPMSSKDNVDGTPIPPGKEGVIPIPQGNTELLASEGVAPRNVDTTPESTGEVVTNATAAPTTTAGAATATPTPASSGTGAAPTQAAAPNTATAPPKTEFFYEVNGVTYEYTPAYTQLQAALASEGASAAACLPRLKEIEKELRKTARLGQYSTGSSEPKIACNGANAYFFKLNPQYPSFDPSNYAEKWVYIGDNAINILADSTKWGYGSGSLGEPPAAVPTKTKRKK